MSEKHVDTILLLDMTAQENDRGHMAGHFRAQLAAYDPSRGYDRGPANVYLSAYDSPYAGLEALAYYGDPKTADGGYYGYTYGFKPEYGLLEVREAERYVKGLKKIEAALRKIADTAGQPESLGQHIIQLMRAVGCARAAIRLQPGRVGPQYRDWRLLTSAADVQYAVNTTIDDHRRTHCQSAAA